PCHSCARRRLRCDRSRPTCHKCTGSGFSCPGYDRVFTWIQGGLVRTKSPCLKGHGPNLTPCQTLFGDGSTTASSCSTSRLNAPFVSHIQNLSNLQLPFCNIDGLTLQYLKHFEYRVCQDLVAHDHPGSNPFLQLLPLAIQHPCILHIIVANSALHLSNITQPPRMAMSRSTPSRSASKDSQGKSALTQALHAKQAAIQHLRFALDDAKSMSRELLLAAVLFFINFELIDLGASDWQPHLRGAGRLMMLLSQVDGNSHMTESQRILFDVVISDCFIYHILGSTLSPEWLEYTRHYVNLFPILQRTETYCYLCCPTAILQIILSTSQVSVPITSMSTSDPGATEALRAEATECASLLLRSALDFDVKGWISDLGAASLNTADQYSREHVAFAHRAAACLYILQAVPAARARSPVSGDELVADIVAHLSHVDERNQHFKATAWPSFVAGAETRDQDSRWWLLGRLLAAWEVCPWGYIFTAVDMLQKMWEIQDAR
ncbi:hypothetical protein CONLIGDRAFT_553663, partial [Coniochaeta ligniaria NRRL 30616]